MAQEQQREWLAHQSEFILDNDNAPLLLDGGFGAAKTDALCQWAWLQCELYPNNLIVLGREKYTDLADSTIKSFFDLPCIRDSGGRTGSNWNEARATYKHHNKSEILFRHLDSESGLKNVNLGAAGIDQSEEIKPEMFDLLLGRLRRQNASRQIRITANPNGHDWVWQYFYEDSDDYRRGYRVIRCKTTDNPHLPEDYVNRLLSDYPPEFIEQYVNGSREVMLGYRFFDAKALQQQVIGVPLAEGYFVDGFPRPSWRDQKGGPIRIYERFEERDPYCIGADVATGEGFSRCAGVMLNARMNRTAAVIDADIRPDEFAVHLWYVSRTYGNAVIAPERNGIGFSLVTALQQLTSHIFNFSNKDFGVGDASHVGWLTDARSRPELFAQLQRDIARRNTDLIDKTLLEQCKAVTMQKGKPKAEEGFRDDLVIARGIAGMVRKLRPQLSQHQVTTPQDELDVLFKPRMGTYGVGRNGLRVAGR